MGKEISWEIRERAEELYIVDGLTIEQVAAQTNVSASQLKRWSTHGNWQDRKHEYRKALTSIKRDTILLRKRLIEKALHSLDPQDIYAVSRLEAAANKLSQHECEPLAPCPVAGESVEIKTPADAVVALEGALQQKLFAVCAQPDRISLPMVKDIKKALDLVEEMKTQCGAGEDKEDKTKKQLDPETLKKIREEIYGLV